MLYYIAIGIIYVVIFLVPTLPPILIEGAFLFTVASLLFTLYLAVIQYIVIREFCMWCTLSYGFTSIIFLSALLLR